MKIHAQVNTFRILFPLITQQQNLTIFDRLNAETYKFPSLVENDRFQKVSPGFGLIYDSN